jgi:hypothetical protein
VSSVAEVYARLTRGTSMPAKRRCKVVKPAPMLPFAQWRSFGTVELQLPMRTVSEANMREHWRAKAGRVKAQRQVVKMALDGHVPMEFRRMYLYRVTLTRLAPRTLDGDNLQRSFKAVRDEVAACIGLDDGDRRITWEYAQERSPAYGVRVRVVAG